MEFSFFLRSEAISSLYAPTIHHNADSGFKARYSVCGTQNDTVNKLYEELLPKAGIESGSLADIALCCSLAGGATDATVE
jgi:hypothetical protein